MKISLHDVGTRVYGVNQLLEFIFLSSTFASPPPLPLQNMIQAVNPPFCLATGPLLAGCLFHFYLFVQISILGFCDLRDLSYFLKLVYSSSIHDKVLATLKGSVSRDF
jgi:hypothetical protein